MNAVLATVQAVILGVVFNAFATKIALGHVSESTTFDLFPITERIRICMLEAAGVITAANSSVMLEDRAKLPEYTTSFRCGGSWAGAVSPAAHTRVPVQGPPHRAPGRARQGGRPPGPHHVHRCHVRELRKCAR